MVLAPAMSGHSGLTSSEAAALRTKYGPNEVADSRPPSALRHFAGLFLNPLIVILLVASTVSIFLRQIPTPSLSSPWCYSAWASIFPDIDPNKRPLDCASVTLSPAASVLRDNSGKTY